MYIWTTIRQGDYRSWSAHHKVMAASAPPPFSNYYWIYEVRS